MRDGAVAQYSESFAAFVLKTMDWKKDDKFSPTEI